MNIVINYLQGVQYIHEREKYCGTGYLFHKMPHFPGKWSDNLFLGKGIRIVGVEPAKLLYRVPIPQKNTFSVEV